MTQKEWRETFGGNLSSILRERGMRQSELAKEAGLSTSRVSDYVRGSAAPSVFAIINMAYVLDVDISEFIDFDDFIDY